MHRLPHEFGFRALEKFCAAVFASVMYPSRPVVISPPLMD